MIEYVCTHMTFTVISNDVECQNVLFYKSCYHQAAFRSTFEGDNEIMVQQKLRTERKGA